MKLGAMKLPLLAARARTSVSWFAQDSPSARVCRVGGRLPNRAQRCRSRPFLAEEHLLGFEFAETELAAMAKAHEALQAQRDRAVVYAVRSSATAEDLGDASFAGQHETFYEVGFGELADAIRRCWCSLWSEPAVAYRDTQGIAHADVAMAVVVQEMIASEVSGVTFTANPLTGSGDEVVTDAVWGMGSAIVDGRVAPDHFVVARNSGDIVTEQIATKTRMVRAGATATELSVVMHG